MRSIGLRRRLKGRPARFFRSLLSFARAPAAHVGLAELTVVNVHKTDGEEQNLMSDVIARCVAATLRRDELRLSWMKKKKQLKPGDDSPPPEPASIQPEKEVKVLIPRKTETLSQVACWGCRLRLPSEVLGDLDDSTPEASVNPPQRTKKSYSANLCSSTVVYQDF